MLGGLGTLGGLGATDDPISTSSLPREVYFSILDQCATAWDPTDRNIYSADGASLNDVDRATRTAFVSAWQVDAWQRWRWEADCLRAAQPDQVGTPGGVRTTDDAVTRSVSSPRDHTAILNLCATAWDPADRNIYATDGASLNDVDRATRTAFVNLWQIDAWPRWRWEADCLRAAEAEQLGTPGGVRTADDAITASTSTSTSRDHFAILDQCATAWDPADRNIYATDGASLNDVDRATRTAFVNLWQIDAWPRWRWEADCLRAAIPASVDPPVTAVGAPSSLQATLNPTPDSSINPSRLSIRDYRAVLDECAPVWNSADRNIYATDGASLNDVDRATRTAFVTVWQIDAWPRWRWEADCLRAAIPASVDPPVTAVGAPSSPQATLNPTPVSSINPPRLSVRDYRAVLDECAPVWNSADRNIYTTDGASLNDVDRATRTAFVTLWQIDAWPRWRWEADCLRAAIPASVDPPVTAVGAPSSPQATLNPAVVSSINPPRLSVRDYRAVLDECAPVWNSADRNIYTTDGLSLNDVDRATRTAFVTVWQIDAWPRWRWEAECLRATRSARTGQSEEVGAPASVRTTVELGATPILPSQVYAAILDLCRPAWDPSDRNIYTADGASLNGEERATRTAFVTLWGTDAWQRWRWESDCLRLAFTPADDSPGGAFGLPGGAFGLPAGAVGTPAGSAGTPAGSVESPPGGAGPRSSQVPKQDPTTHPNFPRVVQTAVARGADDALAQDIAIQVVTEDRVTDFLNGTHEGVLYGEYECAVRSAACPLAPEAPEASEGASDGGQSSSARQRGGHAGGGSQASPGRSARGGDRFAGHHFPICRPNGDGTSTCHINPEWPVLEYRDGQYYRCKGLSPEGYGIGCRPY